MEQAKQQLIFLMDYENLLLSYQGLRLNEEALDWSSVLARVSELGKPVVRRAYADWTIYTSAQRELLGLGFDLVHVTSKWGKNAADIRMAIDALDLLADAPDFMQLVLGSGDGDFTALVHRLHTAGKQVIGMGVSSTSSSYLVGACDQFIFIDQVQMNMITGESLEMMTGERSGLTGNNGNHSLASVASGEAAEDRLVLEQYIAFLAQQKVRMTPTEHRPRIILRFFEIIQQNPESSLTELKEKLHAHYENNPSAVRWQFVHETIHQLFHTFCFVFDQDDSRVGSQTQQLWDRRVALSAEILSAQDLLRKCDLGLLSKVARKTGSAADIRPSVAATLLYGNVASEKVLNHVQELLRELEYTLPR